LRLANKKAPYGASLFFEIMTHSISSGSPVFKFLELELFDILIQLADLLLQLYVLFPILVQKNASKRTERYDSGNNKLDLFILGKVGHNAWFMRLVVQAGWWPISFLRPMAHK
jgi:hypothetical protein